MPVVEVILPAVRRAVAATRTGRIGVIGTRATIASGAYDDVFAAARDVEVTSVACPRFVDFVERGMTSGRQILGLAQCYLAPLQEARVDTVVLGCTHYPLLAGRRCRSCSGRTSRSCPARRRPRRTSCGCSWRATSPATPTGPPPAPHEFLATGDPEPFRRLGRRFLGPEIGAVAGLGVAAG